MTTDAIHEEESTEKGPARRRPPARAGCLHDGGTLTASTNPFKVGRLVCEQCGCAFVEGELLMPGRGCAFAGDA